MRPRQGQRRAGGLPRRLMAGGWLECPCKARSGPVWHFFRLGESHCGHWQTARQAWEGEAQPPDGVNVCRVCLNRVQRETNRNTV